MPLGQFLERADRRTGSMDCRWTERLDGHGLCLRSFDTHVSSVLGVGGPNAPKFMRNACFEDCLFRGLEIAVFYRFVEFFALLCKQLPSLSCFLLLMLVLLICTQIQ